MHIQNQGAALCDPAAKLHALLQMAYIKVNIMPAMADRGPVIFKMHRKHDAEAVIGELVIDYGSGRLKDSDGATVLSDPQDQLEAGEYFFTPRSDPQGVTHSLFMADTDHFSSARLGYRLHKFRFFSVYNVWRSRLGHGPAQNIVRVTAFLAGI